MHKEWVPDSCEECKCFANGAYTDVCEWCYVSQHDYDNEFVFTEQALRDYKDRHGNTKGGNDDHD